MSTPTPDHISFEFEGTWYSLPLDAADSDCIQLPDGRVLTVGYWGESTPPRPCQLTLKTGPEWPVAKFLIEDKG